jgi:hypothetical protein
MKKSAIIISVIACFVFLSASAQQKGAETVKTFHKYVIERDFPGAGKLSPSQLQDIARKSCLTISKLQYSVQWVESYVTDNKIYCVYLAENEEAIREHGKLGGFPVTKISEVKTVIDPTTAQ